MGSLLHILSETVHKQNYVTAAYYTRLPREVGILKKTATLTVGQTIETRIPIPGIMEEIREGYIGKVVNVFDVPSLELVTQIAEDQREYLIQIAYPSVNFGTDLPLLITALLGNDASTSAQVELLDIEFSEEFVRKFRGPQYRIKGVQSSAGIDDRPILLNMIKPYTGLTPREGARIFHKAALGGADPVKDDELFGNPVYGRPGERVRVYREAAEAVHEKTGERVRCFVNTTSGTDEIIGNVKRVEEADTDGLITNLAAMGYSMLKYMAEHTALPILGHSVGIGMRSEGTMNGMASSLAVGKLVCLAGTDIVVTNIPYRRYPLLHQKYMQTVAQLTLPFYDIKPSMPFIGGRVHPGMVEKYIGGVGKDVVLAAGGAVQGHLCSAVAEARATHQTIDIVMNGQASKKATAEKDELCVALTQWDHIKSQLDIVYFTFRCYAMSGKGGRYQYDT